jgi:hypothetical protein
MKSTSFGGGDTLAVRLITNNGKSFYIDNVHGKYLKTFKILIKNS